MNMIKVMSCKFEQCLGTFTMLLVEESSETLLCRHLSNHVFGVRNFGNTKAMRAIFLFERFKISARFKRSSKKLRKTFFSPEIIASELVSLNCLYEERDNFHLQPMC